MYSGKSTGTKSGVIRKEAYKIFSGRLFGNGYGKSDWGIAGTMEKRTEIRVVKIRQPEERRDTEV